MADVCFDRGYFATVDGEQPRPNVYASQLMTTITAKMIFMDLGESILLMQSGPLVAPIFVLQSAPYGNDPWWTVSVVQYHSINPSANTSKVNVWRMFSLESLIGKEIDEELELYVYPSSVNKAGLIKGNQETRLKFRPAYMASMLTGNYGEDFLSLKSNERVDFYGHVSEIEELTGKKRHGLLTEDNLRDDYPTVKIAALVQQASKKYTLETEAKKLLGVTDEA